MIDIETRCMETTRKITSFSPGHVTGFFEIRDDAEELLKRGSRGSGFNVRAGATTTASLLPISAGPEREDAMECGPFSIVLRIDGRPAGKDELPVTREMLSGFFRSIEGKRCPGTDEKKTLLLELHFDLPPSQGFGMSGAGLLSQALALNLLMYEPIDRNRCVELAHAAEVNNRTGLGDIPAQSVGGFTIREREGLPPFGIVHSSPLSNPVILAVLGSEVHTKGILPDDEMRKRINSAGSGLVEKLLEEPTLERMVELSNRFAVKSGLMDDGMNLIVREINKLVTPGASMCMLGGSMFVIFPEGTERNSAAYEKILRILEEAGEVFETDIHQYGAVTSGP